MGGTPANRQYAIACGIRMIPIMTPDITSPQMYSLSLYFGSQRTTGKNPIRVDRTFGPEQVKPFFSFDLRTATAGCCWRTRRSRSRGGWGANGVSVSGETSSMFSLKKRRQHKERKEKVQTLSAAFLDQKHRILI